MWDTELAKELIKRNNKKGIGSCIGTVLQEAPLKISIMNGKIIIDRANGYICSNIIAFKQGDKVLVNSSEDDQTFFIAGILRKID